MRANGSTWWLCDYCLSKEQLTQRTAELEAANIRADKAVQDRADVLNVKSTDGLTSSEWIMRTATAERKVKDLQAELERVRGERDDMQRAAQGMSNDLTGMGQQYEELHALVAALPKVEGEINERFCTGSYYSSPRDYRTHVAFEAALVALLKHRQGMEG